MLIQDFLCSDNMENLLTPTNISLTIAVLSVMFGIFFYFKNPQIDSDKKDALLAQQVQWEKEATEKRFVDMGIRMDTALTLAQNHTHTVDIKCDKLIESVNALSIQFGKLETIIDERIPKKQV